jgi:Leucine-rich repeat (LRR) protein
MRQILAGILISISVLVSAQTTQTPEQIRQRMAGIRRTTNWDDPAAAKKANEEIRDLAKVLMSGSNPRGNEPGAGGSSGTGNQKGSADSNDAKELAKINQAMADQKMNVYSQIWKAAAGGEGADILLAEPLREEIVKEYEEEDSREPVPFIAEELEVLVIDVSMRGVQAIIDVMPVYKSVRTLIVTNTGSPVPVNLAEILKNAINYPLTELYIVNLGFFVTTLPREVSQFRNLGTLGIFNNRISTLPAVIGNLRSLKRLYADNNPLETTLPVLNDLVDLQELGLINTKVPESEISGIRNLYPSCKIIVR